jgi:hypothetical protein
MYYLCIFVGEGITILTGREIDDTYLDSNEEEIKKQFQKLKKDWLTHGITLMCDSWTGPMGMSIINFMIYYNGVMFFVWRPMLLLLYQIYVLLTCQSKNLTKK